jgi:hypothetical protein
MPKQGSKPLTPPLYVARVDRTYELKLSMYKAQSRMYIYVFDGSSRRRSQPPVLLPEAPGDRVAHCCTKTQLTEADLTEVFVKALLDEPATGGEMAGGETAGGETAGGATVQQRNAGSASEAAGSDAGGIEAGDVEAGGVEAHGVEAAGVEAAGFEAAGGMASGVEAAGVRPVTRAAPKPVERFSESEHSTFSAYELSRLGARHDRVRDVSYTEAVQKLEEMGLRSETWLHEVRRICTQMDIILDDIPSEHAAAARALQAALVEMLDDAGEADDDDQSGESCEPCELCEPSEPDGSSMTEAERVATAYFQEVTEAVGWSTEGAPPSPPLAVLRASHNGCAGGLLLTHFELLWIKVGSHFSDAQLRMPLREIERAGASLHKSPFGSRAEMLVATRGEKTPLRFACGSALADVELFSLELATAVAAIPGTAPVATDATAAPEPPPAAPAAPAQRQTKQRLAAADLRQKLKQVVDLQRSHTAGSSKKAAEILAELQAAPDKAPSIHTAYKQSEHLRDIALGFGGYAQARLVIQQFLKMPAVQLILPDALRELQQSSSDASVALELMGHAKQFFTEIFGVGFRGGRRSDEDRNAFAAASAAILPRDLFAKRGRAAAAARLTGLGYRQMHRGSDQRRELEDCVRGWRRIRTAEHTDKINWGPLKDAWHSDLLSTEDNQNKDMVSCCARFPCCARIPTAVLASLALPALARFPLPRQPPPTHHLLSAADPRLPRRRPRDRRDAL